DAINRLQISDPNISWSDVQNVLIAAYCRVVSRKAGLTAAERWGRMRQFVSVLEQQIAANRLAPGTLLIANVPLPPDVFRELRSQAAASGQTTTQLLAAILTRAAGKWRQTWRRQTWVVPTRCAYQEFQSASHG